MKRVFLSFDSRDLDHVRGLRLLKDNPDYELEFYDYSVKTPINSTDEAYIKSVIKPKIKNAHTTLCLISETTYTSDWVDWELETSAEEGNKIVAMAIKGVNSAILPSVIKERFNQNLLSFHSWDPARLTSLL